MHKRFLYRLLTVTAALGLTFGSVMTAQAAWEKAPGGRWWYSYDDSTYATGWTKIGDDWYYFDASGWMVTGWFQDQGCWFYLDPINGTKTVNQWVDGYYLGQDGIMVTDTQAETINKDTVFALLRQALTKEGLYPNAVMRIDHENGKEIVVNIGDENTPTQFKIYNSYTINKATGAAVPSFAGPVLNLK